jgi:hypothetical protein
VDSDGFDAVARALADARSRRRLLGALGRVAFGGLFPMSNTPITARKRFNRYGCLNVGQSCAEKWKRHCCSGVCDGTGRCIAHHASTCQPHQDAMQGELATCGVDSPPWSGGVCDRTTGKASFCGRIAHGEPCRRESECPTRTCAPTECVDWPGAACSVVKQGQGMCTIAPMDITR